MIRGQHMKQCESISILSFQATRIFKFGFKMYGSETVWYNSETVRTTPFCFVLFCLLSFFRAAPVAYGGSQARGRIGAVATVLLQSHSNSGSEPCLWTTPQLTGNAGSLTHWARPGIEPATSWFLNRFVSAAPRQELKELNSVYSVYMSNWKFSTTLCPFDFGQGFSQFWASGYTFENGNNSNIRLAFLTEIGRWAKGMGVIYE